MQDINNNTITKKTIIFSGGTDGIGRCALNYLVKENDLKFILPVRNLEKGENVVKELKEINPNADFRIMKMDLSSFESIKSFANEFNQLDEPLDILVNNAGIVSREFIKSIDGYEMTLATNHLGTSLLTLLLLPKLNKSIHGGNIVIVSSKMHDRINKFDFDTEMGSESKSNFSNSGEYSKSKLYNLLFSKELQNKLNESSSNIKVNSLHPGFAVTSLSRDYGWFANKVVLPLLVSLRGNKLEDMGQSLAELTLNKSNIKGEYFFMKNIAEPSKFAKDPINATKLWNKTCQLLSIDPNNLNLQ